MGARTNITEREGGEMSTFEDLTDQWEEKHTDEHVQWRKEATSEWEGRAETTDTRRTTVATAGSGFAWRANFHAH